MTTSPQQVTSRYTRNLLIKGKNNEFVVVKLERKSTMIDNLSIGLYYDVELGGLNHPTKSAVGVTPEQAVYRCLQKHGVSFR